jgi:cytochrome c553
VAFALGVACAGSVGPRIQTGPGAVVTSDGLHQVDGVPRGTLFMRRDYVFGSYEKFTLGEMQLTFKPGARVLDEDEAEAVKARFDAVAREVIRKTGRVEVSEGGPCVARVNFALIDLDLMYPIDDSDSKTMIVDSFGKLTLVFEIRDDYTDEPLMRYAQRRSLEGGMGVGPDPAKGPALTAAFRRFAGDFRRDFDRAQPQVAPTTRALTCEQRAGLVPFTPGIDAQREFQEAMNLSPDRQAGAEIYEACAECHQPGGEGVADGSVPRLAGQHRSVIMKQLADIRAGYRDNPTMYTFASEAQLGGAQAIADVTGYIQTLEARGPTGRGPGDDLAKGEKIYKARCVRCHGLNGEGDDARHIPRIQSQHFAYLMRQIVWIREGTRHNADPEMRALVESLAPREIHAVVDYVSHLPSSQP